MQPFNDYIKGKIINVEPNNTKIMSKESNLQIYEMLTALFVTISKGQQILDSIKEVLTTFDLFHPLVLFKYLTKNTPILQPKHILTFLEENNFSAKQEDIKIIFSFQGVKEKMNYSTFLKMIYPYSMTAIREISTVHLKNYYATENLQVNEQILACFFLLITQHIQLINKIEVQKQDSLKTVSKEKISKVLKNIKKLSQKSKSHCQKNPNLINGIQLIYFIKNFTNIEDSSLIFLLRRLGTNHHGSIQIQKLQAFVKPWKKKELLLLHQNQENEQNSPQVKRFNEEMYRKELNSQLQRSISEKKQQKITKRKAKRQSGIKIKQGQFQEKKVQQKSSRKNTITLKTPIKQNLSYISKKENQMSSYKQKSSFKEQQNYAKKLFIKFIEVFLKNSLEIERLKEQLNKGNQVNYLKIFKSIDKGQRGIVQVDQVQQFYKQTGGVSVSITFNILVEAFSQTGQNWLSYSEFCQIFKPSIERSQRSRSTSAYFKPQTPQSQKLLFSQILYLTLQNEYELLQIRRQFSKHQLFHLFTLINKEETGFINYQQLKSFLNQTLNTQLSMYQLMLVLKRLDRSKNGVVSQNQFVDYFLVKM